MSIYEFLKENNDDVLFCDRSGNLIAVYCKNNVKVLFEFSSTNLAQKNYRKFRRELENIKV